MAYNGDVKPVAVLLAEDDEISQEIVRHVLSALDGVELTVVADGKEALEAAMGRHFDLMIFDRNMPHISGDRVLRYIKAGQAINSKTPTIQFTAFADRVSAGQGTVWLADAIVPKPIRSEEFLAVVRRLLGR